LETLVTSRGYGERVEGADDSTWSKIGIVMATPRKQPSILSNPSEEEFHPRTPLGRKLWEIRQRIVDSGEPLLDWEDLEREVAERRGERTGS
jgi:hypothetical protein